MIFEVPGGPKSNQKRVRKPCATESVLQERLGSLSGSILEHFGFHFGSPNRLKSIPKSKLNFEAILEPKKAGGFGGAVWPAAGGRAPGGGDLGEFTKVNVGGFCRALPDFYQSLR